MKITKFKKISKDKYKVYLEDNSIITLYEDVIINNNLLLTKEVDDNLLEDLVKENNDFYVYNLAINYISIRIRSKKEIIDYLSRKNISNVLIENNISKLEKNGYINDFEFAKAYVNDQMILSNKGPNKIKNELLKYGITSDLSNEVVEELDKDIIREKLSNLFDKQLKIKNKGSFNTVKMKLLNYFYNLGYDKEMILDEIKKHNIKVDIDKLKKEYDKLYIKYGRKYKGEELKYIINQKLYSKGYSSEDINKIKEDF